MRDRDAAGGSERKPSRMPWLTLLLSTGLMGFSHTKCIVSYTHTHNQNTIKKVELNTMLPPELTAVVEVGATHQVLL
jgi:hypothetical protein